MDYKTYKIFADAHVKKSNTLLNSLKAFAAGGVICMFGQGLISMYKALGINSDDAGALCSVTLIFLTGLLTGIGVFDKLAKHAGAGTLVPITGFANAIAAAAIDNKAEGQIAGLGSKLFVIAGPVILFGTLSAAIYGVIYYFYTLIA